MTLWSKKKCSSRSLAPYIYSAVTIPWKQGRKLCGFFVVFLGKFSSIQGWMMLDGYQASSCHLLRRITAIKTPKNLNKILFSDLCMSLSKPTKLQTVIINHDAANGKMGWHVNHTNIKWCLIDAGFDTCSLTEIITMFCANSEDIGTQQQVYPSLENQTSSLQCVQIPATQQRVVAHCSQDVLQITGSLMGVATKMRATVAMDPHVFCRFRQWWTTSITTSMVDDIQWYSMIYPII